MSIYTYLHQDHEDIKDVLRKIEKFSDVYHDRRLPLFDKLKAKIRVHSRAEEKAFYLPLKLLPEIDDLIHQGEQDHRLIDQLVNQLSGETLDTSLWQPTFLQLKDTVERHFKEEERVIFKKAKALLDVKTTATMEMDIKREKIETAKKVESELFEVS